MSFSNSGEGVKSGNNTAGGRFVAFVIASLAAFVILHLTNFVIASLTNLSSRTK